LWLLKLPLILVQKVERPLPSEFRCSLVIAQAVIIVVAGVLPIMPKRVARKVAPISFTRWIRVITKCSLLSPELIVAIIAENKELSRIVTASIRTARSRISAAPSDEN